MSHFTALAASAASCAIAEPAQRLGALLPLAQIQAILRASQSQTSAMGTIAKLLQTFGAAGVMQAVAQVLREDALLADIAARSYLHGNGFLKLVLAQTPAFKLRLHLWMPGCDAQENCHDHRWHFASAVLQGNLSSEIWEEAHQEDAPEFAEYLYLARQADQAARLVENGKTRLVRTRQSTRSAGEAYTLAPGVLHRIVKCGSGLNATLMCQASPARSWNRLIPHPGVIPHVEQRFMTPPQLVRTLEEYLRLARCMPENKSAVQSA